MTAPDPNEFLFTGNHVYVAEMYERYLDDPGSVDRSWQEFFAELGDDAKQLGIEMRGASWAPSNTGILGHADLAPLSERMSSDHETQTHMPATALIDHRVGAVKNREATLDSIRALMLIRAYRVRGHLMANLDPLGLEVPQQHSELMPGTYGFSDKDLDRHLREVKSILDPAPARNCGSRCPSPPLDMRLL